MKLSKFKRLMYVLVGIAFLSTVMVSYADAGKSQPTKQRVYYYVPNFGGHPYFYDMHLGFKYAAEKFQTKIIKVGPDGWDPRAQAEAFEQAIAKKPDGIITILYDGTCIPAIRRAMTNGIPVAVVEANVPNSGALTYVGLDNYSAGVDTAKQLIKIAGDSGNVVVQGNWGASNTDAKVKGFEDFIKANSSWKIVGRVDDKANTEGAIEAAKSAFNNYKFDAIVGLNSSSGPGIAAGMEELNIASGSVVVICHDREDTALEYIAKGYIQASIINKTATSAYQAILMLEAYNNEATGYKNVPISGDNLASDVNPLPEVMYLGTVVITKENVEAFKHDKMPEIKTKLFR